MNVIGHELDRFIGTWSAEQEAELLAAVEVFEQADESFWQLEPRSTQTPAQ